MRLLTLILGSSLICSTVFAQVGDDILDTPYSFNQRNKAKEAVLNHLRHEDGTFASFCEGEEAPMGCESRVGALVNHIFDSAREHRLNPWLFLAVAVESSGFNPFHVAQRVRTGIMGLTHTRAYRRNETFFTNSEYRTQCFNTADACQENIIEQSAQILREAIDRCTSDEAELPDFDGGLRRYVSGSCRASARFATRVLAQMNELQEFALTVGDVNECDSNPAACFDPIGGLEDF